MPFVNHRFCEVSSVIKSWQLNFEWLDDFLLSWCTQGTLFFFFDQFFPPQTTSWSKSNTKLVSSRRMKTPSTGNSFLEKFCSNFESSRFDLNMISKVLPWVLIMSLKFELWAEKEFNICEVCLKLSTCWKDLKSSLTLKRSYCSYRRSRRPSSSKWRVSATWGAEKMVVEEKFSVGTFWIISSKIDFRILPPIWSTSSSTQRAFVTVFKKGVKVARSRFSWLKSSCGKNAR